MAVQSQCARWQGLTEGAMTQRCHEDEFRSHQEETHKLLLLTGILLTGLELGGDGVKWNQETERAPLVVRWQIHIPPGTIHPSCRLATTAQLYSKHSLLPELPQRPPSGTGLNSNCGFQGSFLLGSVLHSLLASERRWPRHCLTNEWLVSLLPGGG